MTGVALVFASACGSDTSTKVEGSSGNGGTGGGSAGHGGASGSGGSGAKGGASGHAGSLGANAGESQGGAAGELGAAGASTGGTNAGAGGALETSGAGGEPSTAEAGAGGALTEPPMCSSPTDCAAGSACVAGSCVPVAGALTGLRWQLPCTAAHGSVNCACPATDTHTAQLTGVAGVSYSVTLHFRGIVEQKTYSGGTAGTATGTSNSNLFLSGGTPAGDTWNIYELDVSSPAQTFYLNAGSSGTDQVWLLDYRATVVMAAGSTITLTANSVESVETFNRDNTGAAVVVPGVPPDPQAYDGQFVQVDVESVKPM